jgi:hypothetical protein
LNGQTFLNLYKVYNLYILMDFYLVLSREVCPRSSRPHSRSMNQEEEEELQFKISPRE